MSNVSIFEKKWLDIVFENKNKEYGAYKLRQESQKTTFVAFFFGLFFISAISGVGLLLSSFGNKPIITEPTGLNDSIIVTPYNPPIDEPVIENPSTDTTAEIPIENNKNYVVAPTDESKPDIPTNETPVNTNPTTTGTGTTPSTGETIGKPTLVENPITEKPSTEPVITGLLDVQPNYPTGINGFRKEVGNKFNAPEIDASETTIVSVLMSFVIEKDGSLSNIKVLKSSGEEIDNEAIRVLKSIKTKWTPGKKDGQSVRTYFTLPIKVEVN